MAALGERVRGPARIYVTGGGTAVLEGWREMTIDLDVKAVPEPPGFFEAIAELKETVDLNVELAAPDDFIPAVPGWPERSRYIGRWGTLEFYHYDPYSQALSKIERGHARDLTDVDAMIERGLVHRQELWQHFQSIELALIRYPGVSPAAFRAAVLAVCGDPDNL
ncbi:MAG: hypothetical protein Q7S40_32445 [Opitutaceae bacterium]|nr:hypothetical protein [Opitutaceae bacterium]